MVNRRLPSIKLDTRHKTQFKLFLWLRQNGCYIELEFQMSLKLFFSQLGLSNFQLSARITYILIVRKMLIKFRMHMQTAI